MNTSINEKGELILNRTAYMQWLLINTYPQVAIKAILNGTLEGAHESAIADQLYLDIFADQNPQAFEILDLTGDTNYTRSTFIKAAYLVTGSKANNYSHP
jgi:hypothetical protein